MCDEAVDDSLATLKLVLDWFVTSKMIKRLYYSDAIILIRLLAWILSLKYVNHFKNAKWRIYTTIENIQ